jgi:DUF4097 and DUF4098 domain-containing protein YvlB
MIMRNFRSFVAATAVLLVATVASAQVPAKQSVEKFRSAAALTPGGSLLIDNAIGQIIVLGSTKPGLRWEVVKVVRGLDADAVQEGRERTRLELAGMANARVLRTLVGYPLRNGRWDSSVGYRIEVPADTNVNIINIASPQILVRGITGSVTVKNVSGRIELDSVTGEVRVESVNAIVRAKLPPTLTRNAFLSSVSGRVELAAPPSTSFNWTAETARGGVHAAAAFRVRGFFRAEENTRRYYAAINGNAGPTVVTSSVLGDVYLLRPEHSVAHASVIAAPQEPSGARPAARPTPLQPETRVAFQRVTTTLLMQMPSARSFAAQQAHIVGDYEIDAPLGSIFVGQIDGDANVATRAGEIVIGRVAGKGDLRSLGGSLHLGDITGPVTAHTSVGDIVVRTALKGGSAVTDAGLIRIGRASGPVELRSGGGDVIVHRAEGPVDARTRSGDVRVAVPDGVSTLRIDAATEDGNVMLQLPPGFGAEIDAVVVTSNDGPNVINTDIRGLTVVRDTVDGKTRIRARGKVGGGGQKVTLRATEGTIQIRTR